MKGRARALMLTMWVVMMSGYAVPSFSAGDASFCVRPSITIKTDEPIDDHDICDGVEDALTFFGRLGLSLSHPLTIVVMSDLPEAFGDNALGCYQEEEQTVYVLTFSAFEERGFWFGVPAHRAAYRSLVTHEVAHAVAGCNFKIPNPTYHAHEYVAYVAMLATMNHDLREQVLTATPGTGFDELSEINELTHAFDPRRFGIDAYRHYLKPEYGDAFLLKVLSGEALTNTIHELP